MEQRFFYSFAKIDTKVKKQYKEFNEKKKYTLKQVEYLIKSLQEQWDKPITLDLICKDELEDNDYTFDEIVVTPFSLGGLEVSLIQEIENQIYELDEDGKSLVNNAGELLLDINNQYTNEANVQVQESSKKAKEGSGLKKILSKFSKKNKNTSVATSEVVKNEKVAPSDFEEIEEIEEIEEVNEKQPIETVEAVEAPEEFETVETEENAVDELSLEEQVDEENTAEVSGWTPQNEAINTPELNQVPMVKPYLDQTNQQYGHDINRMHEIVIQQKKHESVQLPPMQEYCDLGEEIHQSINDMTEKLKTENLIKFVGIPPVGLANVRIDEYRINHANVRLSETQFENLRATYTRTTNSLKSEALEKLRAAVDLAWKKPYDLIVEKEHSEEIAAIKGNHKAQLDSYIDRQNNLLNDKVEKLKSEQELALQAFIAKQQTELNLFVSTEEERVQNLIDARSETIKQDVKEEVDKFIDDEIYKLKIESNDFLYEGKKNVKEELALELTQVNDECWDTCSSLLKNIQNEIQANTPGWAKEIKEFNELEEQEHKRAREQKELQLREETIAVERTKAEIDKRRMEELEHENKMLNIKLQTSESKNELYEYEQVQSQIKDEKGSSKLNLMLGKR